MSESSAPASETDVGVAFSGASVRLLGMQLGAARGRLVGSCVLVAYFVLLAALWILRRQSHALPVVMTFAVVAGPMLMLGCARTIGSLLRRPRSVSWPSFLGEAAPASEVEGWHVSAELGIAVVSLRSGVTLWVDLRGGAGGTNVPPWLTGATQWGTIRFYGLAMRTGGEWAAAATPAIFAFLAWAIRAFDILGKDFTGVLAILMLFGPLAGLLGYLGTAFALLSHPSIALHGDVADVFAGHETLLSALRVSRFDIPSQGSHLELFEARPEWQGGADKRLFRPPSVFDGNERPGLSFDEAEAMRRIIEERARRGQGAYRIPASESSMRATGIV